MDPLHPHDPPAIGPFRLLGRVGEDADVRRYLAEGEDGTTVTLAVVRPARATDPAFRTAFARRIEAVRSARSPYLAPIVAAEPHGAVPWAAAARPGEGTVVPVPRETLPLLARDLARGLADLHAAGAAYGPFTARDVLSDGTVLAGPVPAADADAAAEDVLAWAGTLTSAAGGEGVPLRLRPLVDLCLNPDPGLRPSAADLVRMLDGADRAAPVRERPSRRPLVPLLAGGLALAAVAAVGAVLLRDRAGSDAAGGGPPSAAVDAPAGSCSDVTGFAPDGGMPEQTAAGRLEFSPDGSLLAVSTPRHGITLWDWREKTPVAHLGGSRHSPQRPVFSPLGCTVVALEFRDTEDHDHKVVSHDLLTGTAVDHLGREPVADGPLGADPADALSVAVGPTGRIIVGTDGPETLLFEPDGTEPARVLESSSTRAAAFLDEDRVAGLGGGAITVWDVDTGEALHTVRPTTAFTFAHVPGTDDIVHVVRDRVVRWNAVERTEVASFAVPGHDGSADANVHDLTLDAEHDRVFVSWGEDVDGDTVGRSDVRDMATGAGLLPEDAPYYSAMAFHPDGGPVAAVTGDGGVVLLAPDTLEEADTLLP
ncbi:WD40 repeat domain-containing protein [Nocardiopsis sp. CC223A]|uniref:WD40 repeat domain-containing protein n=1 Tax=Nocardiopsis sp. CC223A TaxID=3044051 RepID=UPI00278C74D5|nr:WD40 repeat domain-containing protein [Nocardiopsis sp. CC223A]